MKPRSSPQSSSVASKKISRRVELNGWQPICALLLFFAVTATISSAQTLKKLVDFNVSNGAHPLGVLVQGRDSNFYGTTEQGGPNNFGTVFKMTASGTITTIYSFCSSIGCTDGAYPNAGLVLGNDGNFYRTTFSGGENYYGACSTGCGTIFKVTPAGILTTIYTLCSQSNCLDGQNPAGVLYLASDGSLYGTTQRGGANGIGTVFKIFPSGLMDTLSSFCPLSGCTTAVGGAPESGIVQGTDGNFYGTTEEGGTGGQGTVFKMTPSGAVITLHSFCSKSGCSDGSDPWQGLVQGTDGNFYGTTYSGGAKNGGTVFKIAPSGTLTTLYNFCSQTDCTDGSSPYAGLARGSDGNFYGATQNGGDYSYGTLFRITSLGTLTTLQSFDVTDGSVPVAGLMQAVNGGFYGTTAEGGADSVGTVFSFSMGLDPVIEASTYRGKVGSAIGFLGQGFTTLTTVFFNGTGSSHVKVVSGNYLLATVPSGATTGTVSATTSGGTLKSNNSFHVIPQITSFSPESGSAGTIVTIDGESFTSATSVAFGGVPAASFKVDSYTGITATVPSSAKTGKIIVTTPGGTAASAGTFAVP